MSYNLTYQKYQKKYAVESFCAHQLPKFKIYDYFIVIPAYNEYDYIEATLQSINKQKIIKKLLVIVVINNSNQEEKSIVSANQATFTKIESINYDFELILIDCFSKPYALHIKYAGVGMARKVGMDFCLSYSHSKSLLCSLDADTLTEYNYLELVAKCFENQDYKAAVVGFTHQKSDQNKLNIIINEYESILKYNALQLDKINSPYGYVSMGSTMICTVDAYISIGGMPKKKATEDFYFLQQLAKHTKIIKIKTILVHPSSRAEERVYLGTGFRMKNPKNFDKLKISKSKIKSLRFLFKIMENYGFKKFDIAMEKILNQDPALHKFLCKQKINENIKLIIKHSKTKVQFLKQFHRWFDNLKTHQFVKI